MTHILWRDEVGVKKFTLKIFWMWGGDGEGGVCRPSSFPQGTEILISPSPSSTSEPQLCLRRRNYSADKSKPTVKYGLQMLISGRFFFRFALFWNSKYDYQKMIHIKSNSFPLIFLNTILLNIFFVFTNNFISKFQWILSDAPNVQQLSFCVLLQ